MPTSLPIATATVLLCAASASVSAAPQPIESFARRPQMHGVTISADGRYIAFLSGSNDDTVLMTFDRNQSGSAFRRVTASEPGKFDLGWCRWANDKRLLCGLYGNIRGSKFAELPFKRMFAVDADGTALKTLEQSRDIANTFVAKTSVRNFSMAEGGGATAINKGNNPQHYADWHLSDNGGFGRPGGLAAYLAPERQDEFIDLTPDDDDTVLVQLDDNRNSYPTVFQLNIYTGNSGVRLEENPPIRRFVTDGRGNPRLGWGTQDLKTFYYARLEGDRDWRKLGATQALSASIQLRPIAMTAEANTAYAIGPFEGRDALWTIDLADKREPQMLFKHPLVDVGEPILQTNRRLLGLRYDVERPYVWYADEYQRQLIERLERQFPGRAHEIADSSEDKKMLVIQVSSDVDLGTYYLFDTVNVKLQKLGAAYPELDQSTLGTMTNITYKASDGTEIPGYLTVPTGAQRKNLPLVVMPHDGPAARDSWKFSFLRTFLANRGYAVLQMNYRGSSGFGQKWQLDGQQDWGGVVYSDIQDATRWAVGEGIADPKRICIMGWGFGGYEALLGAARNGDAYRCAVSIAGITDLDMYEDHGAMSGEKDYRRALIGTDREKVKRNSPVENAAQIGIPVLLVHGDRDWQVQVDHAGAMAKALKKQKKPVEEVIIKGAGHELERKSDRVTLLKAVEEFLAKHLGPGAAT
jgi:dipeptidyl aminopeptidase/acylaminoacyl peptidase